MLTRAPTIGCRLVLSSTRPATGKTRSCGASAGEGAVAGEDGGRAADGEDDDCRDEPLLETIATITAPTAVMRATITDVSFFVGMASAGRLVVSLASTSHSTGSRMVVSLMSVRAANGVEKERA